MLLWFVMLFRFFVVLRVCFLLAAGFVCAFSLLLFRCLLLILDHDGLISLGIRKDLLEIEIFLGPLATLFPAVLRVVLGAPGPRLGVGGGLEGLFEAHDLLLAVVEMGDGLPGGFLLGVALPLDQVVRHVVVLASLQDLLHLPLLLVRH